MEKLQNEVHFLRAQLKDRDRQILQLQNQLIDKEKPCFPTGVTNTHDISRLCTEKLTNESIARHSRQLILPEIGVKGQLSLANTSALIVGCGGLGCPSGLYLTAAGIGRLGLVDYDEVELTNLHRQVLHTESSIGVTKSSSAALACTRLNSKVECVPYHVVLNSENALDIIKQYDIVLDCTDNVATRYLLNDACVLAKKPLVSGSALRFEGQLTVYNYQGGPCYRCLYPKPPPPETVTNCSDGGVLGVIPGIIGCLQALEVIKIVTNIESSYKQKMLLFDGLDGTFRNICLRPRQPSCIVCGDAPSISKLINYEEFCGSKPDDKCRLVRLLESKDRISPKEYASVLESDTSHVLVDVRLPGELEICKIASPLNIPLGEVNDQAHISTLKAMIDSIREEEGPVPVYVVCRAGNDSQRAVVALREKLQGLDVEMKDIKGGLLAWASQVDSEFPVY